MCTWWARTHWRKYYSIIIHLLVRDSQTDAHGFMSIQPCRRQMRFPARCQGRNDVSRKVVVNNDRTEHNNTVGCIGQMWQPNPYLHCLRYHTNHRVTQSALTEWLSVCCGVSANVYTRVGQFVWRSCWRFMLPIMLLPAVAGWDTGER